MKLYPLLLTGLVLFSTATFAVDQVNPERVDEVRQHTQEIVPYSVDKTLQIFTKTVHGGVQHVVTKSPDDTKQIKLVQDHLRNLAENFSKGDFSVTQRVHGDNMPGLAQLKLAEPYDIKFKYEALPNGAQIHYSSEDTKYIQALHEWFDAQMHDHDNTPLPEHIKHHLSPSE